MVWLKQHCFDSPLGFSGHIAIAPKPGVVFEEQPRAVVGVGVAGVYWEIVGSSASIAGISELEVFSSEGSDLQNVSTRSWIKADDVLAIRTVNMIASVFCGFTQRITIGWLKQPESIWTVA
jgi:hypothetical protein